MTSSEAENPRAAAGSNSLDDGQLLAFVERIEWLEEEEKTVRTEKKEVYAEAKGNGYDVKILRKVIARRRIERDRLDEEESLIDLYEQAIARRSR